MWKRIRRVLVNLVSLVSVCLIIASVLVLLKVITTKQGEAPSIFGYSLFRVVTGSMEPQIPVDSLILVKREEASDLQVGEVISFYSRDPSLLGEVNTHRIVEIHENEGSLSFTTKGDANNIVDRYDTREEDLLGKVVFSSASIGKFVRLLSNPLVFFPFIILPLAILIIKNIIDSVKTAKALVREEEEAAVREAIQAIREKKEQEKIEQELKDSSKE